MARYDIHVVPEGDRWAVIREGDPVPVSLHPRRAPAERAGRQLAADGGVDCTVHPRTAQGETDTDDPRLPGD